MLPSISSTTPSPNISGQSRSTSIKLSLRPSRWYWRSTLPTRPKPDASVRMISTSNSASLSTPPLSSWLSPSTTCPISTSDLCFNLLIILLSSSSYYSAYYYSYSYFSSYMLFHHLRSSLMMFDHLISYFIIWYPINPTNILHILFDRPILL